MMLLMLPAMAAAQLDDTLHLTAVEVVTRRPYADLIPAQILDSKRLEGLSSHSVADAMRYFAGIQIKDYGGIGGIKTVDMRSMGTNHMGIFYDGIQLGNAQNGQIDLGKFSLDNVESINLYNGQRSEIFQSAKDFGSAGTVYIQSRRPTFEDNKPYNVNVTMKTGSFGLANPSVRLENRLSSTVSSSLNAEYTYATGRYKFRYRKVLPSGKVAWDTTATRHNGDIEALRLEGGLYGTLPRGGYWQMKAYYYDSERGIPGAIVNNVWKNSQRQWDRDFFAQGRVRHKFSQLYSLQVNAKYARDYMRYLNPDTTLMYVDNKFWQDELYVSAANRFTLIPGCLTANASVDYQWNSLKATIPMFSHPLRHTVLGAVAVAWDWRGFKAQGSLLGTWVNDRYTMGGGAGKRGTKRFDRLTPAVFASYSPDREQQWTFRAFYKRIFRMPTFNDLYYTDVGNARLKPEYATQYNIGATWHHDIRATLFSSLELTADGYYNLVTDKIIAVPKGNGQYRWMMMNLGRVKIRGIDVTVTCTLEPLAGLMVNVRGTYTYQRAQDYTNPDDNKDAAGTYRGQIAYVPRHSASAVVGATWRGWQLDYSYIYVGERYHNSSNIPVNYILPWYTSDISLSYQRQIRRTHWRLTLEVNNLLNQQYEVIRNYPMPGRHYRVILRFDI